MTKTNKKDSSEKAELELRGEMRQTHQNLLDEEFRKGARIGLVIGLSIFLASILFGE